MKSTAKMLERPVTFLCGVGVTIALMVFYYSCNEVMQACFSEINSSANEVPIKVLHEFSLSQEVEPIKTDIDLELLELLQKAAMDDKTIIMTEINAAWSEPNSLFDLFLESFHVGDQIEHLLNHMIVVATDEKAFDKCKSVHPHCYRFNVDGVDFSGEKGYKSKDYLTMMWTRNRLQRRILELGYNFLSTDTDIMWFRNPFQHISVIAQITISSNWFQGVPDDLWSNNANGGFLYAKSTNRTIAFFKDWYEARLNYTGKHDQDVFDLVKYELSTRNQVKIRFLDTSYIGGMCQYKVNFTILCTFHLTCVPGLERKLYHSREILDQWKNFKENNQN